MQTFKNRAVAATAAMIATIATVGFAAPLRAEPVSKTIAYGDLDLSTNAGSARMARRIRQAAVSVCGPLDLSNRTAVIACRTKAAADARISLAAVQSQRSPIQLAAAR